MKIWPSGTPLLTAVVAALGIVACGCTVLAPQKDQTRYFVLTPTVDSSQSSPTAISSGTPTVTVGLGPISLPPYLERPEVITRLTNSEFLVSENDRWGESLDNNVSRVLAQDLSDASPHVEIVAFPWAKKTQIDYKVSVEFLRLERTMEGQAQVQALWAIRQAVDNKLVRRGATSFSIAAGNDQNSASAALSSGVAVVAREIAQVLDRLAQAKDVVFAPNPPAL